jgi:hypothetical protein
MIIKGKDGNIEIPTKKLTGKDFKITLKIYYSKNDMFLDDDIIQSIEFDKAGRNKPFDNDNFIFLFTAIN